MSGPFREDAAEAIHARQEAGRGLRLPLAEPLYTKDVALYQKHAQD